MLNFKSLIFFFFICYLSLLGTRDLGTDFDRIRIRIHHPSVPSLVNPLIRVKVAVPLWLCHMIYPQFVTEVVDNVRKISATEIQRPRVLRSEESVVF